MYQDRLQVGGAVCFWSLAKSTNRVTVEDGLKTLGLEEHVPKQRTPMGCLRAALDEVYQPQTKKERYVIRPIKQGFAVVCELPDKASAGDDWGTVVATATLDEKGAIELDPFDYDNLTAIKASMAGAAEWLTAASVSESLIGIIERLGGVTLRPSGGIYWLNEDKLDRWAEVSDLIERASARKDKDGKDMRPSMVHVMKVVADEQMVRAVGEALENEITSAVATIEAELNSGELKAEACERRLFRAGKLLDKVKAYESSFGIALDNLHAGIERVSMAAALATMQASAAGSNVDGELCFA